MTEEEKRRNPSDTMTIGEAPPVLPRPVETAPTAASRLEEGFGQYLPLAASAMCSKNQLLKC